MYNIILLTEQDIQNILGGITVLETAVKYLLENTETMIGDQIKLAQTLPGDTVNREDSTIVPKSDWLLMAQSELTTVRGFLEQLK